MIILGFLLLALGTGSAIYGDTLNNDVRTQIASIFSEGYSNPGNQYIYLGIAVAIIGVILLASGLFNNNNDD